MLGYMMVRKSELRFREYDRYRAYYCGLCRAIGEQCGAACRMALSFEMAFLSILLTSLYEDGPVSSETHRCVLHPLRKQPMLRCGETLYCADLAVMAAHYDLLDGWQDDRRPGCLAGSMLLSGAVKAAEARRPREAKILRNYVEKLHALESAGEDNLDAAANLTGEMLAGLYDRHGDVYGADLRTLGGSVGKFIYLCDSFEDLERDERRHAYNPLLSMKEADDLTERIEQTLSGILAPGAEAFERLPLLEDAEILRNILYSGIWQRFEAAAEKRGTQRR